MERAKVAENSRLLAGKYLDEKNFGRAFAHYLVALKIFPRWKSSLKEKFSRSLCEWGLWLEKEKRFEDLFSCYEQALEVFPENEFLLNNLGAHLLRYGYVGEAVHYFGQSLKRNPRFARAARNIDSALDSAVERWHFRMLNDIRRNEAFRKVLSKIINRGFDKVLDIGTGTGILSLFCVEGKAKEVNACESSPSMIEIAKKVFQRNRALEVKLIEKRSTELQVPLDIPERVSLVVAEIVDSGLLGEGILETLEHAWDRLLLPPWPGLPASSESGTYGYVVPYAADLHLAGIECDEVFHEAHVENTKLILSLCFNDCEAGRIRNGYDSKNLKKVRFRFLTNVEKIIRINFNRPDFIKKVLQGHHDKEVKLRVERPGRLDCFVVWFDLLLDEDTCLSTGPHSESNFAWDQAIFFPPRCRFVHESEEILAKISFEKDKLNVDWVVEGEQKFLLSEDAVKILNDRNLREGFELAAVELAKSFRRPINVLDCYPFPAFGLGLLAERKAEFDDRLVCVVPGRGDKEFVDFIAKHKDVRDRVAILEDLHFEQSLSEKDKFDVILMDFVEWSGDLKEGVVSQMQFLKRFLKAEGVFMPRDVVVWGQLLYSEWILRTSKIINDEVTCGYVVGDFLNKYQTRHFIDLDVKNLEKTFCSAPFQLFSLESSETSFFITVDRFSSAPEPNALIYWYKIKFTENCECVLTNSDSSLYHQAGFFLNEEEFSGEIKLKIFRDHEIFYVETS